MVFILHKICKFMYIHAASVLFVNHSLFVVVLSDLYLENKRECYSLKLALCAKLTSLLLKMYFGRKSEQRMWQSSLACTEKPVVPSNTSMAPTTSQPLAPSGEANTRCRPQCGYGAVWLSSDMAIKTRDNTRYQLTRQTAQMKNENWSQEVRKAERFIVTTSRLSS